MPEPPPFGTAVPGEPGGFCPCVRPGVGLAPFGLTINVIMAESVRLPSDAVKLTLAVPDLPAGGV